MHPYVSTVNRLGPEEGPRYLAREGRSMAPTLGGGDLLEVSPADPASLRIGDVILFSRPGEEQPVAHRVARITPTGILTRGDNNHALASWLLQTQEILGRVTAVHRGGVRLPLLQGHAGYLVASLTRQRRALVSPLRRLLGPLYRSLAHASSAERWLPSRLRPRVVLFKEQGQNELRLVWGRRIVGRLDHRRGQWLIQAPFRLLVNEATLPDRVPESVGQGQDAAGARPTARP